MIICFMIGQICFEKMEIKVKKLVDTAVLPQYMHSTDAAMDVTATSVKVTDDYVEYGTGLAFKIPEDTVMLIFPRSSNSKKDLLLANSVGVLDANYVGELKLRYKRAYRINRLGTNITLDKSAFEFNISPHDMLIGDKIYDVGDRVGQIMVIPRPKLKMIEVDELPVTDRGTGGFGSTNTK